MTTAIHRIGWFIAYLACAAGLMMVLLGVVANRNASSFDYEGSSAGYYEMLLDRFRSADALAKAGVGVFSAGAVVMVGMFFAGRCQHRHHCP
jgi:hypothetical protein